MKEQARRLVQATLALVKYIEDNQVYDKLADGGCGLYDTYRSDHFEAAVKNAQAAAQEMEKLLNEAG